MTVVEHSAIDELRFDGAGLIPVVTQDARTGEVLMQAWMNRDSIVRTLDDRSMWYWSRSRQRLWHKGDTSGSTQVLEALHTDCDGDALLALVRPMGPACHTGDRTCFGAGPVLASIERLIESRIGHPADGYTDRLLRDENLRHKKLGEETIELVSACINGDSGAVASEAADLIYHVLVASAAAGVGATEILQVLLARRMTTREVAEAPESA